MTEHLTDRLDPTRAAALQVALGQAPTVAEGRDLPPFFHQLYFWTPQPPAALGRDGHPKTGQGLIPDLGLPRRMWAGGRLAFHGPLIAGHAAEKTSAVESTDRKQGRTGPLAFVTLRHEIRQDARLCLTEWQDLVYREDPDPTAPQPEPPQARGDETDADLLGRLAARTRRRKRLARASSQTVAQHVTSLPVPAVVGTAMIGVLTKVSTPCPVSR